MAPTPSRPLVGLTSYRQVTSWWSWEADAALVPGAYLDMVDAAGGQPVLVPPSRGSRHQAGDRIGSSARLVEVLDALVLTGGGDVDARRYAPTADPRNAGTNPDRDALELDLVRAALAADLPVLAVCRGMQVLNVALGGDLVQHLPEPAGSAHRPRPGAFGPVQVTTEPSSTVGRILGGHLEVLCSHHQALGSLAPGLRVTATSADGVVEAVELPGHRFAVGVQWHPEEGRDARLFEALVAAVRTTTERPVVAVPTRP